ncbi:hypothetical protein LUX12_05645 [Streptomyces somaliensis]|uniref:hypothetical protein n=1 Tax=Streptomyces somaliensis TaxID=78355 RepID=UPI0020CE54CB|nr:hypothetical protein [Streptomyces somaliensis]MCP9944389.1 hypothetical protein [Streptomyces somaliensis]MCP9962378.1 hypothetical protein [Streptomyces somaliensis]MCP9975196.1 hypothetical protein [Streptomyces somaliensis]
MKFVRAVATGVLGLTLAGCVSGGKRDYAVPDPFCQVQGVSEAVVKPLLPTGQDLHLDLRDLTSEPDQDQVCVVRVDEKDGLQINTLRNEANIDALHYAREGSRPLSNAKPSKIPGVTSSAIGDDGALLSMNCPSAGVDYLVTTVRVGDREKPPENPAEQRRNLETFLRSYVPGLIQAKCTK